jgi:hypothetical protein
MWVCCDKLNKDVCICFEEIRVFLIKPEKQITNNVINQQQEHGIDSSLLEY